MKLTTVPLGDVINILSGFAFKSEQFNGEGRGLPLVRIRDVVPGKSETFYEGEFDPQFEVSDGDLLIGMDGEFNRARWGGGKSLLNQRVCRIRSTGNRLDEKYLYWLLPTILKTIEDRTPFVTVKHLSAKELKGFVVTLPPLDEQRRIAATLDQADALRRKRAESITLATALQHGLFFEMFGDPKIQPNRWPTVSFEDACSDETSRSEKLQRNDYAESGEFPVVDQGQSIIGGWTDDRRLLCQSKLPVIVFGDHTKAVKYVDYPFAIGADGAKVLKPMPRFLPRFFAQLLRELPIPDLGYSRHMRELKRLAFPCPPLDLQKQYVEKVEAIENILKTMHLGSRRIDGLFNSLQRSVFEAT